MLTFPDRRPVAPAPVPGPDAEISAKLQWLAINLPHALESIHDLAEAVLQQHRPIVTRPRPRPALTFELNGHLEYRAVTINHDDALVVPADMVQLGRYMGDVVPSDMAEQFLRGVHRARKRKRGTTMRYQANGRTHVARIIAPSDDTVLVTVKE